MKIVVFNKPFDVLSQFREDEAHLTLSHFIHDPDLRLAGDLILTLKDLCSLPIMVV
jgi:23S rRNA pseudouridine2457 synthase